MRLGELGAAIHHLRGRFADDGQAHDDRLPGPLAGQEVVLGQLFHETARIGCGLLHVVEVIR